MTEEEKKEIEIMLEDIFFWKGKSSFITRHRYKELSKKMYKEIEKLQQENQELKEKNTILEGNKIGYKLAIQELKEKIREYEIGMLKE